MPLDKMRGPEQIASAVAYLGSDDAAHVNGTVLKVDGGTLA
jgi:NAD(P)-dependent dehydrogenase (short-subunit alcohol dehydrogenase family)